MGVTDRFYQHQSFKEGGVFIVNMVRFGFISLVFGILGAFSGGTDKPQRKGCLLGFFSSQVIFFILTVFFALIFSEYDVYKVNGSIGMVVGLLAYGITYVVRNSNFSKLTNISRQRVFVDDCF